MTKIIRCNGILRHTKNWFRSHWLYLLGFRRGPYRKKCLKSAGYQCEECKTWYQTKNEKKKCAKKHLKAVQRDEKRTCEICDRKFTRGTTKRRHMQEVHINTVGIYECGKCGTRFTRKDKFEKHLNGTHRYDFFVYF